MKINKLLILTLISLTLLGVFFSQNKTFGETIPKLDLLYLDGSTMKPRGAYDLNIGTGSYYGDGSHLSGITSGGTPASPDTSVQFNNSGSFGGNANFVYDSALNKLTLGQSLDLAPPASGSGTIIYQAPRFPFDPGQPAPTYDAGGLYTQDDYSEVVLWAYNIVGGVRHYQPQAVWTANSGDGASGNLYYQWTFTPSNGGADGYTAIHMSVDLGYNYDYYYELTASDISNGYFVDGIGGANIWTAGDPVTGGNFAITFDTTPVPNLNPFQISVNYGIEETRRIYPYKTIGGVNYLGDYVTISAGTDDGLGDTTYSVSWTWDAVAGVDGYRIYNPTTGLSYDLAGTSFDDNIDNVGLWTAQTNLFLADYPVIDAEGVLIGNAGIDATGKKVKADYGDFDYLQNNPGQTFYIGSGADASNGNFKIINAGGYGSSMLLKGPAGWIGIGDQLPVTGGVGLGGYFNGAGISGTAGTQPIFGVLNSGQSGLGRGSVTLTVYGNNIIDTFNNRLDDGSGNMTLGRGIAQDLSITFNTSTNDGILNWIRASDYFRFDDDINLASGETLKVNNTTVVDGSGYFTPITSTDAAAPNNSIYYSSTQSKLVYKDGAGNVNVLY